MTVYSRAAALRGELEQAREALPLATKVAEYDRLKRRIEFLRKLLKRYE